MPYRTGFYETLSQGVKDIIVKEVAEKVYQEMKTGKYTQDAYIMETANRIANSLNFKLIRHPDCDCFSLKPMELK